MSISSCGETCLVPTSRDRVWSICGRLLSCSPRKGARKTMWQEQLMLKPPSAAGVVAIDLGAACWWSEWCCCWVQWVGLGWLCLYVRVKKEGCVTDGAVTGHECPGTFNNQANSVFVPIKTSPGKCFVLKTWRFCPDLTACGWTYCVLPSNRNTIAVW